MIASSTMGLESVVKDECVELGFENVRAFNEEWNLKEL